MQKNTVSESGFFNLRTITGCAFFFAATLMVYFSFAAPPSNANAVSASSWQTKVDPMVSSAAGLAETEFLIYMKQQADLSGSAALATKEEKGQYVYQQLTATAQATQGNVKQTLTQLGAPFQSFWISNTLGPGQPCGGAGGGRASRSGRDLSRGQRWSQTSAATKFRFCSATSPPIWSACNFSSHRPRSTAACLTRRKRRT